MAVRSPDWLDLMRREYLRRFVPGGGSAIKFVVGADSDLTEIRHSLEGFARDGGLHVVAVNAASTKIHMIQDVFFAAARSIDWERLAQTWVEELFRSNQYAWPRPGESVALTEVAVANDVDATLLRKQVQQWLAQHIMRENELAQDFRSAMANLCMRRMELGDERATAPVVEWLSGDLRTIAPVRQVPITAKITRHNGRSMLRSLCHWLRMCGVQGLVVTLDLRQLARTGPKTEAVVWYTPAAIIDAYEVLRQLIDDAESFEGLFLAVLVNPEFRDGDPKRSVSAYRALKERIWPDVHARGHENPLTPMIQIAEGERERSPSFKGELLEMTYSEARTAIEALRAGVPNRAAIRQLGSADAALCRDFLDSLRRSRDGLRADEAVAGKLVAGDFGAGKSHLLGYLAEQALKENFVVSIVPVSKETPFFDPQRMFAAAIRNAVVPGSNDDVMTAVMAKLDPSSDAYAELDAWASDERSGLSAIFAALLFLVPKQALLPEDIAAIGRFFGGATLGIPKVRQWLRDAGALKLFGIGATRAPLLALQRLRFAPRLFAAAGYGGWCIVIDEMELIGRYSTLQRGRSYAELCRWLNLDSAVSVPGIVSVAAITTDFKEQLFDQRLDQEKVPAYLLAKGLEHHPRLAGIGMTLIESAQRLTAPDEERLHRSLDRVRELYAESYGWPAYGGDIGERRVSRTMREYIKAWITAWDILRLYGAQDEIDTETLASDYSENRDLEHAPVGEPGDEEAAYPA